MDHFRFAKIVVFRMPLIALLPLLLVVSPALAATQKQANSVKTAKPVASSDFYHYGEVCAQNDAPKGLDSSGSLSVTGSAMEYISELGHRQELPPGQALALVQAAKKADPAQRQAFLKAFLSGYQDGMKQMSTPVAPAAQPAKAEPAPQASSQPDSDSDSDDPALQNLRTLGVAIRLYLSDHNRTFPRMVNAKVADKYFQSYLVDDHAFYDPATNQPFQPNPSLAIVHLPSYQGAQKTIVYYQKDAEADGSRAALLLDGSVARISASDWAAQKKESGIPDQP